MVAVFWGRFPLEEIVGFLACECFCLSRQGEQYNLQLALTCACCV